MPDPDMTFTLEEIDEYNRTHGGGAGEHGSETHGGSGHDGGGHGEHGIMEEVVHVAHRAHPIVGALSSAHGVIDRVREVAHAGTQAQAAIRAQQAQAMAHAVDPSIPPPSPPMTQAAQAARRELPELLHEVPNPSRVSRALHPYAGAIRAAGGVLGAAEAGLGAVQVYEGVHSGNGSDVVQGTIGTVGGGLGVAAALGSAGAAAAAPYVGMFGAGYGIGRTLDEGIGQIRGELGATRTVANRGIGGGTHQVRDDRAVSQMIADATHTRTGDSIALAIAPYLPVWLGGG